MSLTNRYDQSRGNRRNPYSARRENRPLPVVRIADAQPRPTQTDPKPDHKRWQPNQHQGPAASPQQSARSPTAQTQAKASQRRYSGNAPAPVVNLESVFDTLWHYRGLTAVLVLVCTCFGMAGLSVIPKKYSSEIGIYFDPHAIELAQTNPLAAPVSQESISATVDSQRQIMVSRANLEKVAKKLDLDKDPEFLKAPDGPVADGYIAPGVIETLAKAIKTNREDNTYVVTLKVTTKNGSKSAEIANTIVQEFIDNEKSSLNGMYNDANTNLAKRLDLLSDEVRKANQAVEDYRAKNDLPTADGILVSDKTLIALNEALVVAQNKTIQAKARMDFLATLGVEASGNDKDAADATSSELSGLRRQYSEQAAKVASLQSQLGSRHPVLLAAKASLNDISSLVKAEQDRSLQKAQAQFDQAKQAESEISKKLTLQKALQSGSASRLVGLKDLQRAAEVARAQYDLVAKKASDTTEKTNNSLNGIRIISGAAAPADGDGPPKSILMLAGAFGGMMMGLLFAVAITLLLRNRAMKRENLYPAQKPYPNT
jgi:uncharacterized protein involved in exopolysaccharide biosynthesis